MKNFIKKERGLTGIGVIFVLAILAGVVLIVLRLFPLYNEKFEVVSTLNTVVSQPDAAEFTTSSAGRAFMKAIAVTTVNRFDDRTIKDNLKVLKPSKKGEPRILHFQYEARNKFFADIYFVLVFDKKLPLSGPSAE